MDTHPPGVFQIDGNLGAANGMLEALLHSDWKPKATALEFLPALPKEWAEGSIRGVRVRGGGTVDMSWANGRLTNAVLHPGVDQHFQLIAPKDQMIVEVINDQGNAVKLEGVTLAARKGVTYTIHFP